VTTTETTTASPAPPSKSLARRAALSLSLLTLALAAACGQTPPPTQSAPAGTAAPSTSGTTPAAPASSSATPAPAGQGAQTAPVPAGALRFQIVPDGSSASFRVREQLAGRELPSDAVGTTRAVSGQIVIRPDGTLIPDASHISVGLKELQTDSGQRDRFIKSNTLSTDQFPAAEFVPARAEGLPNPLPASGEYNFKLVGPMTVRGVQKEVTWDVTAQRSGNNLTGTAKTSLKFADFNLAPPRVPMVLSITDDIRLEVSLVASQASA
jgi:polyisoprenoid-binding protein YceI